MLPEIQKKYQSYKDIYDQVLPMLEAKDNSEIARGLLENSLYLSVFTTFENYLKELIRNYNYNKSKQGVRFTELSERIAHSIFSEKERQIKYIFEDKNKNKKGSFDAYFHSLKETIDSNILEKHIRFEFLHKDKLNGYYKDLFQEILGDSDFLNNLNLTQNSEDFGGLLDTEIQSDAATFLYEYTDKIRNNIAHENEKFKIGDISSFEEVVNTFEYIIIEITKKYKSNTGFDLEEDAQYNMLDNYWLKFIGLKYFWSISLKKYPKKQRKYKICVNKSLINAYFYNV